MQQLSTRSSWLEPEAMTIPSRVIMILQASVLRQISERNPLGSAAIAQLHQVSLRLEPGAVVMPSRVIRILQVPVLRQVSERSPWGSAATAQPYQELTTKMDLYRRRGRQRMLARCRRPRQLQHRLGQQRHRRLRPLLKPVCQCREGRRRTEHP